MAEETITNPQGKTVSTANLPIILSVGLTVIVWGSAFAGIRAGMHSYTAEGLALLRYLVASAVLGIYALATKMRLPAWRDIPGIAVLGFLGFTLYNVALNLGEQQIPAGTASLIIASAPIYVALMAGWLFHERLKAIAWLGIFLSFVGVLIVSLDSGGEIRFSPSALLVLAAAVSAAIYTVTQKPLLKKYSPLQFISYAIWAGTLFLLVFTPGMLRQVQTASLESTLAVIYLGIFPGAIGYACWSFVLSKLPAAKVGSFLYLVPAAAIGIAWAWLGEVPSVLALLGGVLIVAGVVTVNVLGRR